MFSYSFDEEQFDGEFETREGAIEEARAEMEEGETRFWTGKNVVPDPLEYINAGRLINHIACQDEFCTEWAADWPDATDEQENELTQMLRRAFKEWMDKHGKAPKFWSVENVQEHHIQDQGGQASEQ